MFSVIRSGCVSSSSLFTTSICAPTALASVYVRFASKKAQGSSNNGRDSNPKYRGLKKSHLQHVKAGNILVRQVGTKLHPGENVGCGRDFTLYAKVSGTVMFKSSQKKSKYNYVHVIPDDNQPKIIRFFPLLGHTRQTTLLHQGLGIDADLLRKPEPLPHSQ